MSAVLYSALIEELASIVGPKHVCCDEPARALASSDLFLWSGSVLADAVVRPGSTGELAQVIEVLARTETAIVPRGAGLSYTAGAVPHSAAIVIDSLRLNQITVHAGDLYAVVGAGTSWQALAERLKPHGLRAAQISPISGSHSTIGGAASQNIPGGLDNIIGLTVVLADGSVVHTGSAARAGASAFARYAGPDLTGLFLGDCGAFGFKAEVVVRLTVEREAAFASFSFQSADTMMAALVCLRRRELVTRAMSMDQLKAQSATRVDVAEAASVVKAVVKEAGSVGRALKDLAQLARGRSAVKDAGWSLHLTVEAVTEASALAQMDLARAVCCVDGQEIDNIIPKTMRAKPYSIRGLVGPDGERWVPVHAILPLSRAEDCMRELQAKLAGEGAALAEAGIQHSWIISTIGAYVTIEPMFYWSDQLDAIHLTHLSERNQTRFGHFNVNAGARKLLTRLREELRDVMREHDAVHGQMGRFYPYLPLLDSATQSLVLRIKDALDPDRKMNPGVLGLS